eukprot:TRINITY_DN30509_c0_g1_i1.p1 TRINITY_DN30509_c0_g1~~TRINITY_DN30509_c0_g1_i1.p1  ORF type:complete len:541 (-),score=110.76 TRINITY_DN30509_c0_g1_i1:8-1630(-)
MLSYAWSYAVGDIVDSLVAYCNRTNQDQKQTFVWICCLCINQHRVKQRQASGQVVTTEEFREEFESRVRGIGHVLSLVTPWDDPANLKRTWCVFEAFLTISVPGCTLELIMPPHQDGSFRRTLTEDFEKIWKSLSQVDVEKAEATIAADKHTIHELVKEEMGFIPVNTAVGDALRKWVADAGNSALKTMGSDQDGSELAALVYALLHDLGELDQASELCRRALQARRAAHGDDDDRTLASMITLSNLMIDQGKLTECEPLVREAVEATQSKLGGKHLMTLDSISVLSKLLQSQGKMQEALSLCQQTLDGRKETLGESHPDTLDTLCQSSRLYAGLGQPDKAMVSCGRCFELRKQTLGERHPVTLATQSNLAFLMCITGQVDEGEVLSKAALEGRTMILGAKHADTLATMTNHARILEARGTLDEAEELYRKALETYRNTLGSKHPQTLICMKNLGVLLNARDKSQEAVGLIREAHEGMKQTLGDKHPETVTCVNQFATLVHQHCTQAVSYTHLRAHETPEHLVCRLLLEKKKNTHSWTLI